MVDFALQRTLERVAQFFDARQVGETGGLGFRRTTRLQAMLACLEGWLGRGIIVPGQSRFLDIGCGDGRVNLWLGYVVRTSVGIEIDEWTLEEYGPLRDELARGLAAEGLLAPPDNVHLFHGDSMEPTVHAEIREATKLGFTDFDLFFTFLTLHDEIAPRIAAEAKAGAILMVYGLDNILPRYDGLTLLEEVSSREHKLALYRKG